MFTLMNGFTFLARKNHENPPINTTRTLPMFNNKVFLDLICKLPWRIYNKNKKHKKPKSCKHTKILRTIFDKKIPAGSAKWKFFINWKNTEIVKFLIKFYPMWDFTQDLASSINCQNDKHRVEVKPALNPDVARPLGLWYIVRRHKKTIDH